MCGPIEDSEFVVAVATYFPHRALGGYGVYAVCIETVEECREGGKRPLCTNEGFRREAVGVDVRKSY